MYLDNLRTLAVPEASSATLAGLSALIGLVARMRRRT